MLKLTRHVYGWAPDAALFDYYERVHLNHILAHQHPESGMFAYFMPLSAGARRTWSTHDDSFWCCVGSGMESHSKHGDSIYWHDEIGRAHVCTPVTNAHLVCRLLLEKKKNKNNTKHNKKSTHNN